jgi:hypothetical protein
MHLSGETCYSDQAGALASGVVRQIARVCQALGVSGLAHTLAQVHDSRLAAPPELMMNARDSYRVAWTQQSLVPMRRPDHVAALQA